MSHQATQSEPMLRHGVHYTLGDMLVAMVGVAIVLPFASPWLREMSSEQASKLISGIALATLGGIVAVPLHRRSLRNQYAVAGGDWVVPARTTRDFVYVDRMTIFHWLEPWWGVVEVATCLVGLIAYVTFDASEWSLIYAPAFGIGLANAHFAREFRRRNQAVVVGTSRLFVPALGQTLGQIPWAKLDLAFNADGQLQIDYPDVVPNRIAEIASEYASELRAFFDESGIRYHLSVAPPNPLATAT